MRLLVGGFQSVSSRWTARWNQLFTSLRNTVCSATFKKHLKTLPMGELFSVLVACLFVFALGCLFAWKDSSLKCFEWDVKPFVM